MTSGVPQASVHGAAARVAGTVYGTIVVMATVSAGSKGDTGLWRLAVIVVATVVVLWLAHVYAHGLAESIESDRRLDGAELVAIAQRELPIVLAAVVPVAALVLGAAGVIRESRAIWLALALGLLALAFQGLRYARVERLEALGTCVAVGVNLALGLVIVGLKALLAH